MSRRPSPRSTRRGLMAAALLCLLPGGVLAASPASDAPAVAASGTAVLLDPGTGPRAELRYAWPTGQAFQLTQDVTQSFEIVADGQASSYDMPTIRFVVEVTATDAADPGSTRLDYRYAAAGLAGPDDPELETAIADAYRPILGLTGWTVVDALGTVMDGGIDGADRLDPTLATTVADFERLGGEVVVALPVEPIGVGARWRVTQSIPFQALRLQQVTEYTLTERTDDHVALTFESTQSAEPGPIDDPTIPNATLVALDGTGTGMLDFDPQLPLPTSSIEMDLQMSLRAGGAPVDMSVTAVVDIRPGADQVWPGTSASLEH